MGDPLSVPESLIIVGSGSGGNSDKKASPSHFCSVAKITEEIDLFMISPTSELGESLFLLFLVQFKIRNS